MELDEDGGEVGGEG